MTTSSSSYSHPTEYGETFEGVLSLANEIVGSLDQNDILGKWMAQYIAEKLASAQTLEGQALDEAHGEIADLVMNIWAHRAGAPFVEPPLAAIESVERGLARLDPLRNPWGYHKVFPEGSAPTSEEREVNAALQIALEVDDASGDLVRSLVRYAAAIASDTDQTWVQSIEKTGTDPLVHLRRLLAGDEGDDASVPEQARRVLIDRARNLALALQRISDGALPEGDGAAQ